MAKRLTPDAARTIMEKLRDPVYVSEEVLGHNLWSVQKAIMHDLMQPRARVAVKACHSSGKCVAASEYITLASGLRVQAHELIGQTFDLLTRTDDGIEAVQAHAAFNAVEPVYALTTESGRRVVRNAAHPFWCADGVFPRGNRSKITPLGWTGLHDIRPGQLVAVPEMLPCYGQEKMPDHEIKVLAYLIGDGSLTTTAIRFSQQDNAQLAEFKTCAAEMKCDMRYISGVDWMIRGTERRAYASNSPSGVITRSCNRIAELLRTHGLIGKHSRDKRIPSAIFSLPRHQLCLFLNRLFSTDGWATRTGTPEVGFCSASEGLVRDVQELLLRVGVCARVFKKSTVNAWVLVVNAAADILVFCDDVGIYGKEESVNAVRARAEKMMGSRQLRKWRHKNCPTGLRWERVASVDAAGIEATVAIEVPEHHTFLTTFWEHNTFLAADALIWWVLNGGIAVSTAPTGTQVKELLWGDVHRAHKNAKYPLGGTLNQREWRINENIYALGFSTDQGVRFQGFHGNILIVLDEAPGIRPDIWEAIRGIRAGGDVRILALGNPTISSGPFYDIFASADSTWFRHTIDAFDSPNLEGLTVDDIREMSQEELSKNKRRYLVTRDWVREMLDEVGENSPMWQARVRGQFPDEDPYSLVYLSWVEEARNREMKANKSDEIVCGLDVAGPGDAETVLVIRQGKKVLAVWSWPSEDPFAEIKNALSPCVRAKGKTGFSINVDAIGVGDGLANALRREGYRVVKVNVGEPPDRPLAPHKVTPTKIVFLDKKAQYYWSLRERFKEGDISLFEYYCNDRDRRGHQQRLEGQITSIRYETNDRGKVVIESKEEARNRGVRSPDRAEALMLAFAPIKRHASGGYVSGGVAPFSAYKPTAA